MLKIVYLLAGMWASLWWSTYGPCDFLSLTFDAQLTYFVPFIVILVSEFSPSFIKILRQHIAQKVSDQSDGSYVDE